MADNKDKRFDDDDSPIGDSGDSGLGNLPPLSDFDSNSGLDSDGGLPPLGSFESETADDDDGGSRGLPPIGDIQVETPQPIGGGFAIPPKGFDSNVRDTFSSGAPALDTPGIDTPTHDTPSGRFGDPGSGFQDLAADSDFSPETPEIGPGPDSNVDTPMFDSAFGAGSRSGFGMGGDTPAPTQAMETPLFGESPLGGGGDGGFDVGAFGGDFSTGSGADQFGLGGGGGKSDFNVGTPAPDFSPDTEAKMGVEKPKKSKGGKGGGSPLAGVLVGVAALIAGIIGGPYIAPYLTFLPNPTMAENARLTADNESLKRQNAELSKVKSDVPLDISPQELEKLVADVAAAKADLNAVESQLTEKDTALKGLQGQYDTVQADLDTLNTEFADAEATYEELQQQTAITEARQKGLLAEVDRLTRHVGELDDANQRRAATKDALAASVERLYIQVREAMPLTPDKYAHTKRIQAVEALKDQVANAKWVTPALQDAYTDVYLNELEISRAKEYFFAKLMVTDPLGVKSAKWAECVMNGNWSVDYRTFDGKNIGTFQNVSQDVTPNWSFVEGLEPRLQKEIEERVFASRVDGWAEKIALLVEREASLKEHTDFQAAFSSL
ncbi:MAG: hypothetical protein HYV27_02045 [Candidatus Hydrogenedentes bacterium]|nr:hypothetical protein [Candidatus Hydrogenedentota bacterium]